MTQKTIIRVLINLAARVIIIKMITIEIFVLGVVNIDWDDMYKEIALIKQDTKDYQLNLRYQ